MEDSLLQSQSQDSTSDNAHVINAFCEFTSASREEAVFYLESHKFDLDAAVSTFFDSNNPNSSNVGNNDRNLTNPTQPLQAPIPHSPTPSASASPSSEFSPSESPLSRSRSTSPTPSRAPYALRSRRNSNKDHRKPSGSRTRGVRTLADLSRSAPDASDSDSDDQQEFYAGGEKSGVLVQGPPRTPASVDDIFDQARKMGADDNVPAEAPEKKASKSFTGTARRLTGETISPAPSQPQAPEIVTHRITFWRNGFSVDDGPLRSLDDPQNAPFLESIKKSECPEELRPRNWRTSVHVNLIRKEENYPEQVKQRPVFQGVGRTLGSSSSNNQTDSVPAEVDTSLSTAPLPSPGLVVDESLPITSIQLRLADGTRMVSRFNHHHTIGDVRAFIDASRPGGVRTYQLQNMGFPPKQLVDNNQTIEQAGIENSVVIQKL